jgi:hypothetical protein
VRYPYNMSDCSSAPPQGKRRKKMTIADALTKATEGGYHIHGSDGADTHYAGANSHFSAWMREDNASTFMVAVEETFLDPQFWQALGKGWGWDQAVITVHAVENGRSTIVTRAGQQWLSQWHCFIDHLAAGKTPEAFLDTLTASRQCPPDDVGWMQGDHSTESMIEVSRGG